MQVSVFAYSRAATHMSLVQHSFPVKGRVVPATYKCGRNQMSLIHLPPRYLTLQSTGLCSDPSLDPFKVLHSLRNWSIVQSTLEIDSASASTARDGFHLYDNTHYLSFAPCISSNAFQCSNSREQSPHGNLSSQPSSVQACPWNHYWCLSRAWHRRRLQRKLFRFP